MSFDDLDDLLNGDDELEAAFRELDAKIKLDEMRAKRSRAKSSASRAKAKAKPSAAQGGPGAKDPLADLKAAIDGTSTTAPKREAKASTGGGGSTLGDIWRDSAANAYMLMYRQVEILCRSLNWN